LGVERRSRLPGRERRWSVAGREFVTNTLNLVTAAAFVAIGIVLVVVGVTGATPAPSTQAAIGTWLEDRLAVVVRLAEPVPDVVIGLVLVAVAVVAVVISGRRRPAEQDSSSSHNERESCHESPRDQEGVEEGQEKARR
jgi:Ni,Fe-hydrogenase I small subunit